MKTTIVLMAFNEEKNIEESIILTKPFADEQLVVIAKKSTDKTEEIVKLLGIPYIIDNGKGKGDGIRCAINHVKEGIIVFIDTDGSHDPKDIPLMIKPIIAGEADLVVGSRMRGGSDELHGNFVSVFKNTATAFIQLIINYRFGVDLTDCENGFRAIRSDVAKALGLNANDFDVEQEMEMKALKKKYRVIEVPSHEYSRSGGKAKLNVWKIWWKFPLRLIREL